MVVGGAKQGRNGRPSFTALSSQGVVVPDGGSVGAGEGGGVGACSKSDVVGVGVKKSGGPPPSEMTS